jgi:hypothetical protein
VSGYILKLGGYDMSEECGGCDSVVQLTGERVTLYKVVPAKEVRSEDNPALPGVNYEAHPWAFGLPVGHYFAIDGDTSKVVGCVILKDDPIE